MPGRPLVLLLVSALGLTALSWARFLWLGRLAPDRAALPLPLDLVAAAVFIGLVAAALHGHATLVAAAGDPTSAPSRRRLLAWAIGLPVASAAMLPLLSNDVFSVLAYVDLALHTEVDPFTLPRPGLLASRFFPLVSPSWMNAPCAYGPLQLAFWAPSVAVRGGVAVSLAIVKLLALAATCATIVLLYRYVCRAGTPVAAFAAVALSPVVWTEGAGQAHNDVLAAFFLSAWLVLAAGGSVVAGAAALGLAVASKLTTALPAGMYVCYLAGRTGPVGPRLRRTGLAVLAIAAMLVLCYWPFWKGPDTILVPLGFLSDRKPTNTLAELVLFVMRPLLDRDRAIAVLATASGVLTGTLGVAGAVLAWRARSFGALVGVAAKVSLLAVTLATTVYHAWYLLPCLVLAVELRDPVWRRWLLVAATASLLTDGTALMAYGTIEREAFNVLAVGAACWMWLHRLPERLASLTSETEPRR